MSKNNPHINRRKVLKIAGAGSSLSMAGIHTQTTKAQSIKSNTNHSVRFIEANLQHEIETDNPHIMYHFLEGRPLYDIDSASSELLLKKPVADEVEQEVKTRDTVVQGAVFSGPPATVATKDNINSLPLLFDNHVSYTEKILLEKEYKPELVRIIQPKNQVEIKFDDTTKHLPKNSSRTVRLDDRTVVAKTEQITDERASGPGNTKLNGYKKEYGTQEVEATPIIVARDYGELEVKKE